MHPQLGESSHTPLMCSGLLHPSAHLYLREEVPFLPENSLGESQLLLFPDVLEVRSLQAQPQLVVVANAAASHIKVGLPSLWTSSYDQYGPFLHRACPSPISETGPLVTYETREHAKELTNEGYPT